MVKKKEDSYATYKQELILDNSRFNIHTDARQMCSFCGENIPAYIKRTESEYKTRFGLGYKRVCERCILILSKNVNKKNIKAWEIELVEKKFIKEIKK